jgi:rubrerythrin
MIKNSKGINHVASFPSSVAKRRFQQRYNELENLSSKISRIWGKITLNCRICGINFVSGGSEGVCNICHRNYK